MNNNPATILIVDDEKMIRESLVDILEDEDYVTVVAENAETARQQYLNQKPALVLLDVWMPDVDGISLLREWKEQQILSSPVIIMSGHGTIETAVEATKLGAFYFLEKPLSTSKLLLTVERALQTQDLLLQNAELKAQIDPPVTIVGKSEMVKDLQKQAIAFAEKKVSLLINGKSGSGKKHFAHFIHQHSPWQEGKFVVAKLAGMESEHVVSALIGNKGQLGLLAQANQGTLYIDEISQLPMDAQQILFNAMVEKSYIAGNGSGQHHVSLRIIVGSSLPAAALKETLHDGLFDELTVAQLFLPALREHSEDVPDLLEYFSKYFADFEQLPYRHFSLAAQNTLRQHQWPGNIRELKNLVQRLLIQSNAPEIDASEAEAGLMPGINQIESSLWSQILPQNLSLREAREEFERQYLLEQFRLCDGNIARLAERVGMDRTNLYRKLRSLGIDPTEKPH